jgi:hypothetical protein
VVAPQLVLRLAVKGQILFSWMSHQVAVVLVDTVQREQLEVRVVALVTMALL